MSVSPRLSNPLWPDAGRQIVALLSGTAPGRGFGCKHKKKTTNIQQFDTVLCSSHVTLGKSDKRL